MLYLFGPKETDFINGDSDLIHHTYDEVVDRSKGFYLKFKVALDKDKRYKNIKKEMIINAYTPDGWNQFRVFDIYNHSNHVEVVATQLHYDLNYKKVFPFNLNRATAQIALNVFVDSFKSDLPNFTFTSNIIDLHNFSTDDDLERLDEGHNALEILNRIAARWGGELKVDGYNVHLTHKLGTFTNALLYEHKNISEFVDETSMSEIVTRIHAVSRFRPERAEGSTNEPEEVTIKVVVDSPLIDEYAQVYEEDYTNNDAQTRDRLISWANLKYSTNNIDKPARSIKVETNIIDGQEINYGDDLVLKYTKHDVDEIIRCVGYQYNPNSRQYISVTLGSNINSLSSTITGAVHDSTKNQLSNIEKQVQIIKYASNNSNRVTTGPLPIPDPIEGDMWYYHPDGRPNDVELRLFQDGGWVTIISDMTGENVRRAIEDLELEAEGLAEEIEASEGRATEKANQALQDAKAEDARIRGELESDIGGAIDLAEQAKQDAIDKANQALTDAKTHAIAQDTLLKQAIGLEIDGAIEIAEDAKQDAIDKANQAYDDAVAEADRLAGLRDDGITIDAGQITAGVIDAARLNAVSIVTSGLTTNVIKSTHIETSTATIDKLFATEVMVNRLTAKTAFINSIKAVEIDASKITSGTISTARLNATEIVTQGLTADVVTANHIKSDTALIDNIFATQALVDRLWAKTIWANKISTMSLDAARITSGTISTARLAVTEIVSQGLSGNAESITQLLIGDDVFNTSVTNLTQQKVADELKQEFETVEGEVPFYEYDTPRLLLEGDKSMAIYLPLAADSIVDGKRVIIEVNYQAKAGSKGNHASYIQYGDIKSSEPLLYSSLTSAKYYIYIPPGTRNGNIMDLHTNIINPGNYTWGEITKITAYTIEKTQVPIEGPETGAISSQITQLYNMINMSILGSDGAMSRIAMGEEGIQIDGKLLHITAKTFIDNAVITSAMIDTLDAGKITTGELNASLIRVINLDANSISGNEASFIRALFQGTHSVVSITGDRISAVRNDGSQSVAMTNRGLEILGPYGRTGSMQYGSVENRPRPSLFFNWERNHDLFMGVVDPATNLAPPTMVLRGTGNYGIEVHKPIMASGSDYGLDITWGTLTGSGSNVRIYNQDRTGGIHIASGDLFYLRNGSWRSLNGI